MSADLLLSRLDKVRRTGEGRWLAACPGHNDRHPSLSIRETDDGRVLVHCFAGCEVEDVLAAVGLVFSDLYPPRALADHVPRERHPFSAEDALRVVAHEAEVVEMLGRDMAAGLPLSDEGRERLRLAAKRIAAIQWEVNQ